MAHPHTDQLNQLDELLTSTSQAWLFGAGICLDAGLPLMGSLTSRIFAIADDKDKRTKQILDATKALLPASSHIEHILSHLSDHISIADRAQSDETCIGTTKIKCLELRDIYANILSWIAEVIRLGYVPAAGVQPEKIGTRDNPIVTIEAHKNFVKAIFSRAQAGVAERRSPVKLFTINYDTLLEDALALSGYSYWDGLSGGAIGYRSFHYGDNEPKSGCRAHVIKLHGSIDWHLGDDDRVWRVRDGDLYPSRTARVVIYPQATKYIATQRDPFAAQFDLFRKTLCAKGENVLTVCGYGFGDEHINQEIELGMGWPDSRTTLIVFSRTMCTELDRWRKSHWSKRLYIVTEDGLFIGGDGPYAGPATGKHDWWTFGGATKLLNRGAEACV